MRTWVQRLLFLAAAAAVLAVCRTAAPPGERETETPPVLGARAGTVPADREAEASAIQPAGNTAATGYAYRDGDGELQLELSFDEQSGQGGGTRYVRREGETWEYPFSFDALGGDFLGEDPGFLGRDSVRAFWGTDGSETVEDYRESWEYDAQGRPLRFCSQGNSDDPRLLGQPVEVIAVEFSYREDGTLARKSYSHNTVLLGTAGGSAEAFYDELERPAFARAYITHGSLEYYYFYTGDSRQPDYGLCLDFCGGEGPYAELHRR